jgi:hypothetical protein
MGNFKVFALPSSPSLDQQAAIWWGQGSFTPARPQAPPVLPPSDCMSGDEFEAFMDAQERAGSENGPER